MNSSQVGIVIAFVSALFAVVYTPDAYDIWDGTLAGLTIYICLKLRHELCTGTAETWLARFAMGIALLVVFMVLLTTVDPKLAEIIVKSRWRVLDIEFALAIVLTCSAAPFFPGKALVSPKQASDA